MVDNGSGSSSPAQQGFLGQLLQSSYKQQRPGQGELRHDTEGWRSLESSFRALQVRLHIASCACCNHCQGNTCGKAALCTTCRPETLLHSTFSTPCCDQAGTDRGVWAGGPAIHDRRAAAADPGLHAAQEQASHGATTSSANLRWGLVTDSSFVSCLTSTPSRCAARFVRERGHRVVCALLSVCDEGTLHDLAPAVASRLADGLNDSWSHVRSKPQCCTLQCMSRGVVARDCCS